MTRVLKACAALVVLLFLLWVAYRLSPWSKRQTSLQVEVSLENPNGHSAMLVNDGYLPIVVGVCDTLTDTGHPNITVGDALQRWDPMRGIWLTVYQRSDCAPTGVIEARFSHRWLWPGDHIHTYPFFHWKGDTIIRAGDEVRFLVFTEGTGSDSPSMPSRSFVAE